MKYLIIILLTVSCRSTIIFYKSPYEATLRMKAPIIITEIYQSECVKEVTDGRGKKALIELCEGYVGDTIKVATGNELLYWVK